MIYLIFDALAVMSPVAAEQDGELMGHAMPEPSLDLQVRSRCLPRCIGSGR